MQIRVADCEERGCRHYDYFKDRGDGIIVNVCKAFPNGIPNSIAYEGDKHLKKHKDQKNDIVFQQI